MSKETTSSQSEPINHTPIVGADEAFPNDAHSQQWQQLQWGLERSSSGHSPTHKENIHMVANGSILKFVRQEMWKVSENLDIRGRNQTIPRVIQMILIEHSNKKYVHKICLGAEWEIQT